VAILCDGPYNFLFTSLLIRQCLQDSTFFDRLMIMVVTTEYPHWIVLMYINRTLEFPNLVKPAKMTQATGTVREVLEAALYAERVLDEEINRLNSLETDDYEKLKEKRYKLLKLQYEQQQIWLAKKHGQYTEMGDEKEWFEACQGSVNVVCHFYQESSLNCKVVDKHLSLLAEKHPETRFIKINAEKSPFLTQRLGVWMMPTMLLIQNGVTVDKVEGFAALGNRNGRLEFDNRSRI
jgi:hypothetical protein